jgi:L-aspartate oxidase
LASNSLLEAVVYSQNCAEAVISDLAEPQQAGSNSPNDLPPWRAEGLQDMLEHSPLTTDRAALQATMTDDVGIVKRDARLQRAQRRITLLADEVDRIWRSCLPTQEIIELRNMVHVASLVTDAAILRRNNIGLHYNIDLE